MLARVIGLLLVLFAIILVVGVVMKLVRWAIGLAVIVGIIAVVLHFVKKKA